VTPDVEPGYLRELLPKDAPESGEKWDDIFKDFEKKILPGITHWQHPRFHAYFPAGNCYPSIIGEMLSAGLGIVGFSWAASPSCTELETIILDWLGRMINLPKCFLPFVEEKEVKNGETGAAAAAGGDTLNGHATSPPHKNSNSDLDDEEVLIEKPTLSGGGVILVGAFFLVYLFYTQKFVLIQ
jgi:hypothetical protein